MQDKKEETKEKEVKRESKIKSAFPTYPTYDRVKDYDKEFYKWLERNHEELFEEEVEEVKKRVGKSEKVLNAVKKFIEENWESEERGKRRSIPYLIGVFGLKEYIDKLIVLSFYRIGGIYSQENFKKLMGEGVDEWLSRKENRENVINTVKKFVEENWKNASWDKKVVIVSLIGIFNLKEHLDKLIVAISDEESHVKNNAFSSIEEIRRKGLTKEDIKFVKKKIEENWKSDDGSKREFAVSLIEVFNLKEQVDKLVVLSFDREGKVREKARQSFKKLFNEDVESWLTKEDNRRKVVETVKEFVEENCKSDDGSKREFAVSLIEVFNLKEQVDKLVVLSFDRDGKVREKARESLNRVGVEKFKEGLDGLSEEKRKELKERFKSYFNEDRYEFTWLIKDCSPLLILSVY